MSTQFSGANVMYSSSPAAPFKSVTNMSQLGTSSYLNSARVMQSGSYTVPVQMPQIQPTYQVMQSQPTVVSEDTSGLKILQNEVNVLRADMARANGLLEEERRQREIQDFNLNLQVKELTARLIALEMGPQESELERRVHEIESLGNVRVDLKTGRIEVLRDLAFVPRRGNEKPIAELADRASACCVLDDVANVAMLFPGDQVQIEGHTKGGDSEFWQALADDRARLVGEELIARGLENGRIFTRGLPGRCGLNRAGVVVHVRTPH